MKQQFLANSNKAAFEAIAPTEPFLAIGIVGAGDVVQNRIAPALKMNGFGRMRVAVCSLETASPIETLPHRYYRALPNSLLPLDDLRNDGFLTSSTVWIVATPPNAHVPFALQLTGLCGRVGIEKPIAGDAEQARILWPCASDGWPLYPLDHKLFTVGCLSFLEDCRVNPSFLNEVKRIEGVFLESAGFPRGRAQEDGIADIQWHMFMVMIAAFKNLGKDFEIAVESANVARHEPDPSSVFADATVHTASHLRGALSTRGVHAHFEFLQAKAASQSEKHIRFLDAQNKVLAHVDLGESGWQAHARMLGALMQPVANMRHTLADAILLADLLEGVSRNAQETGAYSFGALPSFEPERLSARLSHDLTVASCHCPTSSSSAAGCLRDAPCH